MAHTRIVVDGFDDDDNDTLNALLEQLAKRQPRNLLRSAYYDGKRAAQQVGTIIPPHYYRLGIVLGWSAKAVDILSRRTNLDEVIWPDGDLDTLDADEVWEANNLTAEISAGLTSSLIHGISFLVNTEGDADEDEPKALIHTKDALNATGQWNNRKRRLDNLLSITGRDAKGKISELVLYLDGRTLTAAIDDGKWVQTDDPLEHDWHVPAEALVYKPRAGVPFGSSRISRAVMSLHDQALRTVVRMEGHADIYSIPELWLLGAPESIFRNADGTQKQAWQVMLGRIKAIPDDEGAAEPRADVKRFDAASPEPHIKQLMTQARLFAGETSIPEASLGVADLANPASADAYIASREDLIAEAEGATDDWTPAIKRTLHRALAMAAGRTDIPKEWRTIAPKWRSPMFQSRAAAADAGAKILAVAPWLLETEVGLELLGLDEQQRERASSERRRNAGRAVIASLTQQPARQTATPAIALPAARGPANT